MRSHLRWLVVACALAPVGGATGCKDDQGVYVPGVDAATGDSAAGDSASDAAGTAAPNDAAALDAAADAPLDDAAAGDDGNAADRPDGGGDASD